MRLEVWEGLMFFNTHTASLKPKGPNPKAVPLVQKPIARLFPNCSVPARFDGSWTLQRIVLEWKALISFRALNIF